MPVVLPLAALPLQASGRSGAVLLVVVLVVVYRHWRDDGVPSQRQLTAVDDAAVGTHLGSLLLCLRLPRQWCTTRMLP